MSNIGRKAIVVDGKKRSDLTPDERGFKQVRLHESLLSRLDEYAEAHGLKSRPAAIIHLLDKAKKPSD